MKKRILSIILLGIVALSLIGCASKNEEVKSENTEEASTITQTKNDIETYEYTGDIKYVPVSYQHINDGTWNGMDIMEYVDLSTGVIYIHTTRFQAGYGSTWEVAIDENGKPIIYEKLQSLREKYGYEEVATNQDKNRY